MRYRYTSPGSCDVFGWGPPRSDTIRLLVIMNLVIWGLLTLSGTSNPFFYLFGLVPRSVWSQLMIWQPFTYLFLHAGFWHVALNMFVLWMFGSELESRWGGKSFLQYYFITGVGAGLVTILFNLDSSVPVVGASGAIYGVLLAYAMAYPDRQILLYFMFPIKVKYFVAFLAVMAFFASIQQARSDVAHLTHLSGLVIGFVYLRSRSGPSLGPGRPFSLRFQLRLQALQEERRLRRQARADRSEEDLHNQVDQILDKISSSGYQSLTAEEQDILYKASIHFSRQSDKD